jgi:hypothetical protein
MATLLDCMKTLGNVPLLLNSYTLSGWVSGIHKYDLCSNATWSLSRNPWQSVCHDWTATDGPTQLFAKLWKFLSSYNKLVDLCVWILFMWHWKPKVSCLVVLGNEGTFGPTAGTLSRESRTNPLIWEVMWIYPSRQLFSEIVTEHVYISPFGFILMERQLNRTCFVTWSFLGLYAI